MLAWALYSSRETKSADFTFADAPSRLTDQVAYQRYCPRFGSSSIVVRLSHVSYIAIAGIDTTSGSLMSSCECLMVLS